MEDVKNTVVKNEEVVVSTGDNIEVTKDVKDDDVASTSQDSKEDYKDEMIPKSVLIKEKSKLKEKIASFETNLEEKDIVITAKDTKISEMQATIDSLQGVIDTAKVEKNNELLKNSGVVDIESFRKLAVKDESDISVEFIDAQKEKIGFMFTSPQQKKKNYNGGIGNSPDGTERKQTMTYNDAISRIDPSKMSRETFKKRMSEAKKLYSKK